MKNDEMTLQQFLNENSLACDTDAQKNVRRRLRKHKRDNAKKFAHEKNDRWIFKRNSHVHKFLLALFETQIASVKS